MLKFRAAFTKNVDLVANPSIIIILPQKQALQELKNKVWPTTGKIIDKVTHSSIIIIIPSS
jgi:hypothetical protein